MESRYDELNSKDIFGIAFRNVDGEDITFKRERVDGNRFISMTTIQNNGWTRINNYYEDGTQEELYEKTKEVLPMTVWDLLEMCLDKGLMTVALYSLGKGAEIWRGIGDELPRKYEDLEVCSFDAPTNDVFTINVD